MTQSTKNVMSIPTISVIVPVHNAADFLPCCLDSLLAQTYSKIEIICVNDGSTDASAEIIDGYALRDKRILVIHQNKRGVSAARNNALSIATGEFITFVDADDWIESDTYERVLFHITERVDLVCFGSKIEGDPTPDYKDALETHLSIKNRPLCRLTSKLQAELGGEVWNKIYRRSIIEQYRIQFPLTLAYGEDKVFHFSYASVARLCVCIPHKFHHYRVHSSSAMAKLPNQKKQGEIARHVFDSIRYFYAENGIKERDMRPVMALLLFEYYIYSQHSIIDEHWLDFCRKIYWEARKMKLLPYCHHAELLSLRSDYMGTIERKFHHFSGNRETFGLKHWSIWSITYEPTQRIYRLLGRRIWSVKYR